MRKLLAVVVVLAVVLTLGTTSIYAASSVVAVVNPSDSTGKWDGDKPHVANGTSLTLDGANSGNVQGYYVSGLEAGKVYKIGYFLTVTEVTGEERTRMNPRFQATQGTTKYENWCNYGYKELADYNNKKVLLVTVVKVPDSCSILEPVIWFANGFKGSLDKIVVVSGDFDFGASTNGYELVQEITPQDGADESKVSEDEIEASTSGAKTYDFKVGGTTNGGTTNGGTTNGGTTNGGTTNGGTTNGGTTNGGSKSPKTGDASAVLAIVAAGAAAFGGLKLRKK